MQVTDSDAEGNPSEFFDYFKVLSIQGFLTCRKHAERIIMLVEMFQDSGFPCFKSVLRTIQNLRKRFHMGVIEEVLPYTPFSLYLLSHLHRLTPAIHFVLSTNASPWFSLSSTAVWTPGELDSTITISECSTEFFDS